MENDFHGNNAGKHKVSCLDKFLADRYQVTVLIASVERSARNEESSSDTKEDPNTNDSAMRLMLRRQGRGQAETSEGFDKEDSKPTLFL